MGVAVLCALSSVFVGAALGLYRRAGVLLGPIRTFAIVSAVGVVLVQLMPDALAGIGLAAFLVAGAAAVLPSVLDRLLSRGAASAGAGHRLGLEVGYAGLLLHQIGDGLGIGAYASGAHADHGHADLFLAISAHTVPVTALVVIGFAHASGARAGVLRAAGLAAATLAGIALVGVVPDALVEQTMPWLAAVVGGLLIHVVSHDFAPAAPERRGLELVAIVLGLLLGLYAASGHVHAGDADRVRDEAIHAFVDLTIESAPALLFGLVIGALLQTYGSRLSIRWLTSGSSLRQAIRGAVVGAPLPLCACGVLPVAQSLRTRGAGPALVVAFLISTPELGVEAFALTVRFLGWELALVRLFAAVAVAIVAAVLVAAVVGSRTQIDGSMPPMAGTVPTGGSALTRTLRNLDELLHHVGPYTLIGLVAAAYIQATLGPSSLSGMRSFGLDILAVTLVAVPSYVCAASATPLAAVLILKGMSPGAVLAGLLLGPATNVATLGFLRASFGTRATVIGIGGLIATVWLIAVGLNAAPIEITPLAASGEAHDHGPVALGITIALGLLVLEGIRRRGLAGWMSSLRDALGGGAHGHHHHGHQHAHDHAHDHG